MNLDDAEGIFPLSTRRESRTPTYHIIKSQIQELGTKRGFHLGVNVLFVSHLTCHFFSQAVNSSFVSSLFSVCAAMQIK